MHFVEKAFLSCSLSIAEDPNSLNHILIFQVRTPTGGANLEYMERLYHVTELTELRDAGL